MLASRPALKAAELKPETVAAFDRYIRLKEARLREQLAAGQFLWANAAPGRKEQLKQGNILTEPSRIKAEINVPDGLIHDWLGAVFIPETTVKRVIDLVQDYNNHYKVYQPEVIDSKLILNNGYDYNIFLRIKEKKGWTGVLKNE